MINNTNNYIKTNVPGLVIDPSSGAVLNVDNGKLDEYKKKRKFQENLLKSVSRVDKLEKEMSEIKELLKLIASKVS